MRFTYRIFFIVLSITLFFVLSIFSSLAQTTNDPNTDLDANACFPGGSLYGTCNTRDVDGDGDIDEGDQNWMWVCGWFLIRVEYGLFSDDILDGICLDIIVEVIEEEEEEKKEKKEEELRCQFYTRGYDIYFAEEIDGKLYALELDEGGLVSNPGLTTCTLRGSG